MLSLLLELPLSLVVLLLMYDLSMETTPGKRLYHDDSSSLVEEEHSDEHSDTIDARKSGVVVAVEAFDDESRPSCRRWYDDANDDNSRLYDELF